MQILFYDDAPIYGGQQMMGVRAAEALLIDGLNVSFMYYEKNSRLESELINLCSLHNNLSIISMPIKSSRAQALLLPFNLPDIIKLSGLIRKTNPSIIFVVQGDIEIGSKCLLAARINGIKVVSYIPFIHSAKKKGMKLAFFRDLVYPLLYKLPNAFITSAVLVADELKRISGRHTYVVRDGIKELNNETNIYDMGVLRSNFNLPGDKFIAAIVARIQFQHKGHDFIVNVASRYASELSGVIFLIVGDGPDEAALRDMIIANKLDNMFVFMPWQDNSLSVINAIDLLLMPSVFEGVPLVMLETMQRRRPILASCTDGMKEVLPDAMLYTPKDQEDFMHKFRFFLDRDNNSIEMLLDKNVTLQKECYSLATFGSHFIDTYRKLVDELR